MMPEIRDYLSPCCLEDAVRAMADRDVTVFCGGTDLALQTDAGQREYKSTLMNIRGIDDLSGVDVSDEKIRIGALTTVTEIRNDPQINAYAPVLVAAADHFASDQIRNAASLGGNICNASPAGDMIIPLLVLDAAVEIASWDNGSVNTRLVPLDGFFTGPGQTVMQDNELLTAVQFNRPDDSFVARFRKSGPRPALEIATVSVGVGATVADGYLHNVRVAMGAVAPTPLRARAVESALEGKPLDAASIEAAVAAAGDDASPIDDVRASAWYRSHLISVFIKEVLSDVLE